MSELKVLIGGFGSAGQPVQLIEALLDSGATGLTVVSNNAGGGDDPLGQSWSCSSSRPCMRSCKRFSARRSIFSMAAGFASRRDQASSRTRAVSSECAAMQLFASQSAPGPES